MNTQIRSFFIGLLALTMAARAAEPAQVAAALHARPPQEAWKVELLKQPLRTYCIDFNWLVDGKHVFPEPGHWADADPAAHVKWYKDAGVTCIQTFVLSANGYAWYKGGPIPEQPGLKHDFLPEVVKLGHQEKMLVMGYYCIGANTLWGKLHPEQSYGTPSWMHIPLTKEYIDYLCVSVEDALKRTGMDGFMLDWLVNTSGKWLDCEKTMYQELLGVPFPGEDKIMPADLEKFNDLAITRCWTRIRDTARKVKPDCILWPNGINHLKLEGVDWLLNEGPDVETTEAARKKLNGRPVRLIQNQVGWSNHDARKVFSDPTNNNRDFYGFAAPYDNSLPLPVAEYLKRPVADFNGTSAMTINDRNIAALIRFYLGKPVEPPPPWPEDLRCEYLKDPLGIDVMKPRLSWKLETGNLKLERGIKQTSYQILVASSRDLLRKNQGDLWDSGKVESDQSVNVEYQGKPLEPRMRCYWKVMVWTARTEVGGPSFALRATAGRQRSEDRKKEEVSGWSAPAMWMMGLLKAEDWSAKWIGVPPASSGTDLDDVVITRATYRTLDGTVAADVTPILKKAVEAKKLPFHVDGNNLGGDPAQGVVKELVVEYTCRGKSEVSRAQDFSDLNIPAGPVGIPAPWFRGECDLTAAPDSAIVTVHSHAYFELYINGVKAGDDVLTPAVSHPQAQTFTVTYDVAHLLKPGKNCLGLWMGKGWADPIAVRAQLDAMVQGKKVTFGTGPEWKTRSSGYSHIGGWGWNNFGGERLDAAAHVPGWCLPGLDTASWSNAVEAPAPQGTALNHAVPLNRIGERIAAKEIIPLADGRYEIDFGTNLTGWLRLKFPQLKTGQVVRLHFADRVFPGGVQATPIGNITISEISCTAFPLNGGGHNLYQTYNQVSEFVSAGVSGEEFCNKFNYAGFRHVVVEGLNAAPRKEDATALLVETALPDAGAFECSDPLINRIHQANRWTLRCLNLGGYIVDCPHRERMGYGDGQVSLEGMMMNFDASGFYEKWGRDWRLAQNPGDGTMPNIAPPLCAGGGGPPWAGVIAALPWNHYLHYGDRRMLEENIAAARRYVEYLDSRATADVMRAWGEGLDFLGDWVPPRRGMDTRNWPTREMAELFCNCYRVYLWQLVENMAAALGRADEAEHARKRMAAIRSAVHAAYYDAANKRYVIDEQIYYAMPLLTGVTPERERPAVMANLVECITGKNKGHLDTGMLGTKFLLRLLSDAGRDDLVLRIYQKKDYPGWGYMVEQGATTLWEQWNGYWSQIHSCFASADTWLYQGLAGIRPDPAGPGFKKIIIKPNIMGDLLWVNAYHDSPYGRIVSNWKREGAKLTMEVTIPANTTAIVYVPAQGESGATESGTPASKAAGVKLLRMENHAAVYEVGSGIYTFCRTQRKANQ